MMGALAIEPHTVRVEMRKIRAGDLSWLIENKARSYVSAVSAAQAAQLEQMPYAYTILLDDVIMICGGVTEYWKNRGEAWAVLDPGLSLGKLGKTAFVSIQDAVVEFLNSCPVKRIEASVECGFAPGHRWVRFLGFELEAKRLRAFLPDGKDASLYSRVKRE